jgi:hypothetical protein
MSHVQFPFGNRRPLLSYAPNNRAFLYTEEDILPENRFSMPSGAGRKRPSKKRGGSTKVRVVKGRVQLRVAGYKGVQSLAPSHLVRHIPSSKLRIAAKKFLGKSRKNPGGKRSKKRRKGKKGKKGRKKKRRKNRKRRKTKAN